MLINFDAAFYHSAVNFATLGYGKEGTSGLSTPRDLATLRTHDPAIHPRRYHLHG